MLFSTSLVDVGQTTTEDRGRNSWQLRHRSHVYSQSRVLGAIEPAAFTHPVKSVTQTRGRIVRSEPAEESYFRLLKLASIAYLHILSRSNEKLPMPSPIIPRLFSVRHSIF